MLAAATALLALAGGMSACGSQGISVSKSSPYYHRRGAVPRTLLRLSHAVDRGRRGLGDLDQGSREDQRAQLQHPQGELEQVLYAIRNGGFSGAIMPENLVVGDDAQDIAEFLAPTPGMQAQNVPSVNITLSTK